MSDDIYFKVFENPVCRSSCYNAKKSTYSVQLLSKNCRKCLVSKLIDILCTYLANRGVDIVTHKVPSYHKKKKITNYLRMCSLIYNFSTIEKSCPMKGT